MLKYELPNFLTELEPTILKFLLDNAPEHRDVLMHQLASSALESRDYTGVGFFTNFVIEESAPKCSISNFELGDLSVTISGQDCGCILFIKDGVVSFLEGFTYGDDWPSTEHIEKLEKFKGNKIC